MTPARGNTRCPRCSTKHTTGTQCPTCAARQLVATTPRYGGEHQQLRKQLAPIVATGEVKCWRCRRLIAPGDVWVLGHADEDPTKYRGAEHAICSARSGAQKRFDS